LLTPPTHPPAQEGKEKHPMTARTMTDGLTSKIRLRVKKGKTEQETRKKKKGPQTKRATKEPKSTTNENDRNKDTTEQRGGTDERANQPIRDIVPRSVLPRIPAKIRSQHCFRGPLFTERKGRVRNNNNSKRENRKNERRA